YLEAIAAALSGMAMAFDRHQAPYEEGHRFDRLIRNYDSNVKKYLGNEVITDLARFQAIAGRADNPDRQIERYLVSDAAELRELIDDLRRVAGDVAGKAHDVRLR